MMTVNVPWLPLVLVTVIVRMPSVLWRQIYRGMPRLVCTLHRGMGEGMHVRE